MLNMFTKGTMSNIAQLLLLFLILPVLLLFMSFISGESSALGFFFDVFGEIEIFDTLMDAATVFAQGGGFASFSESNELYNAIFNQIENIDKSIYQMITVAICVYLMQGIWNLLKGVTPMLVNGQPIIFSVLGVFAGALIHYAWQDIPELATGFMLLLVFVVDMIYFDGLPTGILDIFIKYLLYCIKYVVLALLTIFITAFICILLLVWKGGEIGFGIALVTLLILLIPIFLLLVLKNNVLEMQRRILK